MKLRWFLLVIGVLLVLDTIVISTMSNLNLGVIMPAIIGVPLVIIAIFYPQFVLWQNASTLGKIVKWVLICGYSLFIIIMVATGIIIKVNGSKVPDKNADALIVLGAGVRGDRVSLTLKYRLDAAYDYLTENKNTIVVVSGGQGRGENISEAEAMKRYLVSRGIDENRIVMEDKSTSTQENFLFSKNILDEKFENGKYVYVTNSFHVFRAGLVAQKNGVSASGLSAKSVWYTAPNNYLREVVAVWLYWLLGRL